MLVRCYLSVKRAHSVLRLCYSLIDWLTD